MRMWKWLLIININKKTNKINFLKVSFMLA